MPRIATAAVLTLLAGLVVCGLARADADPASDVLLGENVFYPYNPPVSASLQTQLGGVVTAAHRARFPLKVALIASPIDLGAIPTFFGKPKQYAAFLDQEITFGNGKVPLLVVMPNGYGDAGLPAAASAVVATLSRPAAGSNGLARAATAAVPRLAAAAGHQVGQPVVSGRGSGGGGPVVLVAILGGVCVVAAAGILTWRRRGAHAPPGRRRGPTRRN